MALADWLRLHPGTEVISRDRGGEYAKGATIGAPQAAQVADRFHLRKNLTDALIQALDRRHVLLMEAAKASAQRQSSAGSPTPSEASGPPEPASDRAEARPRISRKQRRQEERRAKRLSHYQQFKQLQAQGLSLRDIALRLKLSRCTVRSWARAESFSERASRPKPRGPLDGFVEHLRRRWEEGCHTAAQLYREVKKKGFAGSAYMVRRCVAAWREPEVGGNRSGPAPKPTSSWRPSARNVAWLLLKPQKDRSAEQAAFLAALHQRWPELSENVALAQEFGRVLCGRDAADLQVWVELAGEPNVLPELKRFAEGLKQD